MGVDCSRWTIVGTVVSKTKLVPQTCKSANKSSGHIIPTLFSVLVKDCQKTVLRVMFLLNADSIFHCLDVGKVGAPFGIMINMYHE
jgi:hypothetical protein